MLVKANVIARGPHIIFGRDADVQSTDNIIYSGLKCLRIVRVEVWSGADAWLDVAFPHVIYITGTRGSGKSFDLGVLIEGISALNESSPIQNGVDPITSILIDTQSQFWTLKYPPNGKRPREPAPARGSLQMADTLLFSLKIALLKPAGTEAVTGDEPSSRYVQLKLLTRTGAL
jgi:hypothetical protein